MGTVEGGFAGHDGGDGAVLQHLRQAEREYRREQELRERLDDELAQTRGALEAERRTVERLEKRAACLEAALKEIHGALFGGDVYALILRACVTISQARRGLYVSDTPGGGASRVRASVAVEAEAGSEPSPFVAAVCRRVLDAGESWTCNDPEGEACGLPEPGEGERFRNFVAAPVVLLSSAHGVVLVADKDDGEFDRDDVESLLSVGDQAAVAIRNRRLERELQSAYLSTISMLADAVEAKDPYTHGHCEMASRYARLVAERLELAEYDRAVVCYSALLHDVGKIGVSDGVLHKPGPLLPEERELMRAHVRVGHDLLRGIPALRAVADVVLHHHEWFDGSGYPDGLRGDQIPVAARIVAAVDAYCAMVTRRSYKEAYTEAHARQELERGAGTQFDPRVVEALLSVLDEPESSDPDDDFAAECGLLPDFLRLAASGEAAA